MTYEVISNTTIYVLDEKYSYRIEKTQNNTCTCTCKDYHGMGICKHLEFLVSSGINIKIKRRSKDPYLFMKRLESQIEDKIGEKFVEHCN